MYHHQLLLVELLCLSVFCQFVIMCKVLYNCAFCIRYNIILYNFLNFILLSLTSESPHKGRKGEQRSCHQESDGE